MDNEDNIIIDVDFEIDKNFDIQLGMVYQGEPMSGGMKATDLNIQTKVCNIP